MATPPHDIDWDNPESVRRAIDLLREHRSPRPRRTRNRTKASAYAKAYYQKNKEKFKIAALAREHRKRGIMSDLRPADWLAALAHFSYRCAYCGSNERLQKEHVHPLSLGGEFTRSNIVPACISCNQSKKDKLLHHWFKYQHHYSELRLLTLVHWIFGPDGLREIALCRS
jgi:5-methylcytosine-specific restriction endonuclease McrA